MTGLWRATERREVGALAEDATADGRPARRLVGTGRPVPTGGAEEAARAAGGVGARVGTETAAGEGQPRWMTTAHEQLSV